MRLADFQANTDAILAEWEASRGRCCPQRV